MRYMLKKLIIVFILMMTTVFSYAEQQHLQLHILLGTDPVNRFTGLGMGNNTSDIDARTTYGAAISLEALAILGKPVSAGLGFQWQVPRQIILNGNSNSYFEFLPIYAMTRINLMTIDSLQMTLSARLGYSVFLEGNAIRNILPTSSGGPLESFGGGLYVAGSLGILYTLRESSKWGMDLFIDTGFEFMNATGRTAIKNYPIHFQGMKVDIGLGFRL